MASEPVRPDSAPMLGRLRSAAGATGRLRFDRFLEVALYDPELGFYTAPVERLGPEGDFYTAVHVHPLFGRTVAERVLAEYERLGRPAAFRIVEMGPGDGRLAAEVAAGVSSGLAPGEAVDYVLVERSLPMLDRALARAAALSAPGIRWRRAGGLGADGPFTGVVLANEFLDALPFRRFVWRAGGWRELFVEVRGAPLRWVETDAPAALPLRPLPDGPRDGAIAEVGLYAEAFVREIADHLRSGAALLLDYGAEEEELIRGHPTGTLAGLRAHRAVEDPLDAPGEVDVSAFVNFTRVRAAAKAGGLTEVAYRPQADALGAWGLPRLADRALGSAGDPEAEVRLRLAVKSLAFGFGTFQVMELAVDPTGRPTPRP